MTLSSSLSSPDKMIISFPNSALPKITLEPHYESLVELRGALKENYYSIPSRRGGRTYSYLGGLQPDAVYAIVVLGTEFIAPPDPGPLVIPSGTNSVTSGNLNRDHYEAVMEFKEWVNLERVGKKNRGSSKKNVFSGGFDRNRGFTHLRVRDIIVHLFTDYGQLEYQYLVGNHSKLLDPWDANKPFQELVQRVQEIQKFVNDGGRTIADKDIVNTI